MYDEVRAPELLHSASNGCVCSACSRMVHAAQDAGPDQASVREAVPFWRSRGLRVAGQRVGAVLLLGLQLRHAGHRAAAAEGLPIGGGAPPCWGLTQAAPLRHALMALPL